MTFPGAETINAGIIGVDCFLSKGPLFDFLEPLRFAFSIPSLIPFTAWVPFVRGGISRDGEVEGLLSEGVSIWTEIVVLELDRE
jgi:hypothetical protein